jgi:aldose 1-epimerase
MKALLCCGTFFLGIVLSVSLSHRSPPAEAETPTAESGWGGSSVAAATDPTTTNAEQGRRAIMSVSCEYYGSMPDGTKVDQWTCDNGHGMTMKLITYGATMTWLEMPDRDGKIENVILTYPDLEGFLGCKSYFGGTVGRFCNRIAKGQFELDGTSYSLAVNNPPNHLHGGTVGFDKVVWQAEELKKNDAVGVRFKYTSPDGDEGYPGRLSIEADYWLTQSNQVIIELRAETTKPTVVNLTNHNYWNLGGVLPAGAGQQPDFLDHHVLEIRARQYLAADDTLIPTGQLVDVAGTPMDFTTPTPIGPRIASVPGEPPGYDVCYALDGYDGTTRQAATVRDESSGRVMTIETSQPGLQFYTGNFLDGSPGSGGYGQYRAFCLETQHYPDSPNRPDFPSTVLRPSETYVERTILTFSVQK